MSESFTCGYGGGAATWTARPNGDRTCTYCGSLHPDDLFDIMQRYVAGEEGYSFDLTTKSYKVYAHRANVQNASQGGIKFYMPHAVGTDDPRFVEHEAAWEAAVAKCRADHKARFGASA